MSRKWAYIVYEIKPVVLLYFIIYVQLQKDQVCSNAVESHDSASYLSCRQPLVPTVTTNSRIRPMVFARIKIFHARDVQNKHPISVSFVIKMQLINVKEQ